jgi:hypothetical protein
MTMNTQSLVIWAVIGIVAGCLASIVMGGGGELTRPIHAIHRTEPAAPDPRLRHSLASLVDHGRGTGDQAN